MRFVVSTICVRCTSTFDEGKVSFFDKSTFTNLKPQVILSFKAWSNGIWGWWAFDVFTFIASYMGINDISA